MPFYSVIQKFRIRQFNDGQLSQHKSDGFSLLELILVLAILSTLTVATTQSIQRAVRAKSKIQRQIDEMSAVRDALKIISQDIGLAFHYRDIEKEMVDEVKGTNQSNPASGQGGNPSQPQPPPIDMKPVTPSQQVIQQWVQNLSSPNRIDPTTHFLGKENEIALITLNSGRMNENQLQADFVKVGYALVACPAPLNPDSKFKLNEGGQCLARRMSALAEGDLSKGGTSVILLRGVQEFKLRYIGKGKQDWVSNWDTKNGEPAMKDVFPDAVEVSVTVENGVDKAKRKVSMQIVVPLRWVNNKG